MTTVWDYVNRFATFNRFTNSPVPNYNWWIIGAIVFVIMAIFLYLLVARVDESRRRNKRKED